MEADPHEQLLYILSGLFIPANLSPAVIISLALVVLLLFASAMVSGSEVAFFSLNPSDINQLEESKSRHDKSVIRLLSIPDRLLATILIANNFINVAIVILSSFISKSLFDFTEYPDWVNFLVQIVIITALIILFGEIIPKIYANRSALKFSGIMAGPLVFLDKLLWPLSFLLISSTSVVNRRLSNKNAISVDDLSDALDLATDTESEEELILKRIVKFGNIDVTEIMKARIDVIAIDIDNKLSDIMPVIIEHGYSRIPVYHESLDNIKGILYIKDILPHLQKSDRFNWQSLIRPPYYVPETKKIDDLLKEFQANKIHMAIVIDEYGGTQGIVTLEDILEEIIGEIVDEDDEVEDHYRKIDHENYIFEAKIQLNDFYKVIEVDEDVFEDIRGDADTLAGVILELKGEIPKLNDKVTYKYFTFRIESVDKRRIKKIHVKINRSIPLNTENEQ